MKKICIIGCGFTGTTSFHHIVNKINDIDEIDIFSKDGSFARGTAYSTMDIDHLLNVPAIRMGAFADKIDDFYKWLIGNNYNYTENSFVPRKIYGNYLESIFHKALEDAVRKSIKINLYSNIVDDISLSGNRFIINNKTYDAVILAVGLENKEVDNTISFWKFDPSKLDLSSLKILDSLGYEEGLLIFGTGLTMVDACISLSKIYNGKIKAISRSGKLPNIHNLDSSDDIKSSVLSVGDMSKPLSFILHKLKVACRGAKNWRNAFDSIRPITQDLWQAIPLPNKKRFLKKLFNLWNIHRHRVPPEQYAKLQNLINAGRLEIVRGDCKDFTQSQLPKINCLGISFEVKSKGLLSNLLQKGLISLSDTGFGIAQSSISNLYIISPILAGDLLEIVAVPELRKMVNSVDF